MNARNKGLPPLQQHKCLWPDGCKVLVLPHLVMCTPHATALPFPMRRWVWTHYRPGLPIASQSGEFRVGMNDIAKWAKAQGSRVDQGDEFTVTGPG